LYFEEIKEDILMWYMNAWSSLYQHDLKRLFVSIM